MCEVVKAIHNELVEGEEILYKPLDSGFKKIQLKHLNETLLNDMKKVVHIKKNDMYDDVMVELMKLLKNQDDDIRNYHQNLTDKYFRWETYIEDNHRWGRHVRKCNNEKVGGTSPIISTKAYFPFDAVEEFMKKGKWKPEWYKFGIEIMNKTYKEMKLKELRETLKMNDPKSKISKMKKKELVQALMKL